MVARSPRRKTPAIWRPRAGHSRDMLVAVGGVAVGDERPPEPLHCGLVGHHGPALECRPKRLRHPTVAEHGTPGLRAPDRTRRRQLAQSDLPRLVERLACSRSSARRVRTRIAGAGSGLGRPSRATHHRPPRSRRRVRLLRWRLGHPHSLESPGVGEPLHRCHGQPRGRLVERRTRSGRGASGPPPSLIRQRRARVRVSVSPVLGRLIDACLSRDARTPYGPEWLSSLYGRRHRAQGLADSGSRTARPRSDSLLDAVQQGGRRNFERPRQTDDRLQARIAVGRFQQ